MSLNSACCVCVWYFCGSGFFVFLLMLLLDGLVLQLCSGGSSLYGVLVWFKC